MIGSPLIGNPLMGSPLIGSPLIGAGVTPGCAGAKALRGMVEIASFGPDIGTLVPLVSAAVAPVAVPLPERATAYKAALSQWPAPLQKSADSVH